MLYTLTKYRENDKTLRNHFKTIVGLPNEKFYKCDIEVPYSTMNVPEGTIAVVWVTTTYTSKEPGGWQMAGYHCCVDDRGFRLENLTDAEKICVGVDAWLEEVRIKTSQ
jgi:hypothetical protein